MRITDEKDERQDKYVKNDNEKGKGGKRTGEG